MAEKKDSASKAKTATKKPASKPAAEKKATPVKKEVKEVKTEVGQLILSHARARSLKAWDRVNDVLILKKLLKVSLNAELKVV
jgi:negative regulator of replication initiation